MTFWQFLDRNNELIGFLLFVVGLPLAVGVGALVWHVFDAVMKLAACHL